MPPSSASSNDANVLALGERTGAIHAGLDNLANLERLSLQLHLAVGEPLHIQEGLDHARQALGFLVDHLGHLLALLFTQVVAAHQFAGSLNGGERGAHLMRDEMNGLLVLVPLGLGFSQRTPYYKVLIAGGGDCR